MFEYAIEHNKNYLIEYLPHLFFMTPVCAMRVEMPFSMSPLWYVFPYLVTLLVFHILLEYVGERNLDTAALLIGLLSFLSIIAKTESGGWNFSYDRGLFGVLPIGYLRAFMGLSIGYLVGRGVHTQAVKEWIGKIPIPVVTIL